MSYQKMYETFAGMARRLATKSTPSATLDAIVSEAVSAIDGVEHASLTRRTRTGEKYQTVAATGDLAIQVDQIQYEAGTGPCLDALAEHHVFVTGDLATDSRWPVFGKRATDQTPVVSMMAHRLHLDEDTSLASLNLYSTQPAAFTDIDLDALNSLATLSAIAMAKAEAESERDNLLAALNSNRRIGIAIGVLMTTYRVTDTEAFTYLRLASQNRHLKLTVIAEDVILTGELNLPGRP